jgi:predicted flap endonuclease-1-like 5' DNA nuclease
MNVFENLTSPESVYIFLWLLGAFILGLIVGWYTWGTVKRKLEAELKALNAEHIALNNEHDTLKLELSGTKASYDELKADYDWKAQRLHDIEIEKGDLHTKIYGLKDKLKVEGNAKIALQNQIDGLSASYNGAKSESEVLALKVKGLEAELEAVAKQIDEEKLAYGNEGIVLNSEANGDLKKANAKIAVLEGKVEGLKEQLEICQGGETALQTAEVAIATAILENKNTEINETEMNLEAAKVAIAAALGDSVPVASINDRNDLTRINGIGEFIEGKLNDLGIFTYKQIANFGEAMIDNLTLAIEFFPGRIERDEWVPQAKELIRNSTLSTILEDLDEEEEEIIEVEGAPAIKQVDVEAAKEIIKNKIGSMIPSATAEDKNDLKVISGVGPFIEEKLNNLGIFTYEQISLFDDEMEDSVTDAIEFFPGRVKRDGWVKQALELLKQKKADNASISLRAMIGGKIAPATVEEKDNLKVISGVGPFIEEKLNSLGIYTYQQMSQFDEEIVDLVTDAIMFFPGRIERDGWVEQAAELATAK